MPLARFHAQTQYQRRTHQYQRPANGPIPRHDVAAAVADDGHAELALQRLAVHGQTVEVAGVQRNAACIDLVADPEGGEQIGLPIRMPGSAEGHILATYRQRVVRELQQQGIAD